MIEQRRPDLRPGRQAAGYRGIDRDITERVRRMPSPLSIYHDELTDRPTARCCSTGCARADRDRAPTAVATGA